MRSDRNEFYGSDAQLRAYHARFFRFIEQAPAGLPVLDLGCGSGIFLELARAHGRTARGVDVAPDAIAHCTRNGLDVRQDDVLHFLETHAGAAYAAIYCCHVIEHLPYPEVCRLLESSQRALAPEGRLVVVTPNPASLDVISETFWLEPTHVRPYPLALLLRMMRQAGFEIEAAGHDDPPGLPRRELPRRWWLRLMLGKHYGRMNSFAVGVRR